MGEVIIPGFPTGMLVPGIYINVELGRQPPSAAGAVRKVLLVGQNAEGTATAGKVYKVSRLRSNDPDTPPNDPGSAEGLFGRNEDNPLETRLFWMAQAAFSANPLVDLYAVKVINGDTSYDYSKILNATTGPFTNQRFHYIVVDEVGKAPDLVAYLEAMAKPLIGFRQQGIIGHHQKGIPDIDTTAGARSQRLQYVWSPQGTPSTEKFKKGQFYYGMMLGAAMASRRARLESVDPAVNLCMEELPGVPVPPPENNATKTVLNNSGISLGLTPFVPRGSEVVILRSVTTLATVNITPVPTYPVLDTTKVTVTDFVADDLELKMLNRYTGFKLAPDTDIPPPAMTATPNGIRSSLIEWLREHEKAGRITTVSDLAERVLVEIDEEVPGRVNFQIPEDVIEILAVGAGNIIQIG